VQPAVTGERVGQPAAVRRMLILIGKQLSFRREGQPCRSVETPQLKLDRLVIGKLLSIEAVVRQDFAKQRAEPIYLVIFKRLAIQISGLPGMPSSSDLQKTLTTYCRTLPACPEVKKFGVFWSVRSHCFTCGQAGRGQGKTRSYAIPASCRTASPAERAGRVAV